MKKVNKRI